MLGITTGVAGLLGVPFPNGLIPQAPFHTNSLCVTRQVRAADQDAGEPDREKNIERVVDHVVEQRVSNLAQGLITLGTMTGPLLIVVGLIPQGVLAGLFFTMGTQALAGNGIVLKLMYLCQDKELSVGDPLRQIKRQYMIWVFVAMELSFFAVAFAITQTVAAIGFPIILIMPIPWRVLVMPRIFNKQELSILDAPTASPFTMESVGGVHGAEDAPLGADNADNTEESKQEPGSMGEKGGVAGAGGKTADAQDAGSGLRHRQGAPRDRDGSPETPSTE